MPGRRGSKSIDLCALLVTALAAGCGGSSGGGGGGGAPPTPNPPADTTPDAFTFTDQTDASPNSVVISAAVGIEGINEDVPVQISSSQPGVTYSINGAAFTDQDGTARNASWIRVQLTSGDFGQTVSATLTVGGVSDSFDVTTAALDTSPDAFSFTDQTMVTPNSQVTSDPITVAGINSAAAISVAGGEYSVDGGGFTAAAGTVTNGQQVRARTTAGALGTSLAVTVTIGGVSDDFDVSTPPIDTTPDAFAFTDQTNVPINSQITSDPITVAGINTATAISVTGGEYSVNGGGFTAAAGTVTNGQEVRARATSSGSLDTPTDVEVTIGGVSDTFTARTTDGSLAELSFSESSPVAQLASVAPLTTAWTITASDLGVDPFPGRIEGVRFERLGTSQIANLDRLASAELRTSSSTLATIAAPAGDTLDFTGFSVDVPSGGSLNLFLVLQWDQTDAALVGLDGDDLELRVPSDGLTLASSGTSRINPLQGDQDSGDGNLALTITATELRVTQQPPANVATGAPFALTLSATDANANTDPDESALVSLATNGQSSGGSLTHDNGAAELALSSGVAAFTTLRFDQVDTFSLDASATLGTGAVLVTTNAISVADSTPPTLDQLTVNDIPPEYYDGSSGFSGTLQVPFSGFTVDVDYSGGAGLAQGLVLTANVTVGGQPAGTDLFPLIPGANVAIDASRVTALIPASLEFPNLVNAILTAQVRGANGLLSTSAALTIRTREPVASVTPFEATDQWFLWFGRDEYSPTVVGSSISYTEDPNGQDDWEEDLTLWGLNSANGESTFVTGSTTLTINEAAENWLKNRLMFHTSRFYNQDVDFTAGRPNPFADVQPFPAGTDPGINIQFLVVDQSAVPSLSASIMAMGGGISGVLGRAFLNTNNSSIMTQNTDPDLGVFTGTFLIGNNRGFSSVTPTRGGTPIGDHPDDDDILSPNVDPSTFTGATLIRFNQVLDALDDFALITAATIAHEVGHSVGLVADGDQPNGLFGSGAHVNTTSLEPFQGTGGHNLMEASTSQAEALNPNTGFNPLLLAHMRNRILH